MEEELRDMACPQLVGRAVLILLFLLKYDADISDSMVDTCFQDLFGGVECLERLHQVVILKE